MTYEVCWPVSLHDWSMGGCRTAGIGGVVLDGVAEAAGGVSDGYRPIAHCKQLVQPARLESRRHQQDVTP